MIGVRAEGFALTSEQGATLKASVRHVEHLGPEMLVHAYTTTGHSVIVRLDPYEHRGLTIGDAVSFAIRPERAFVFDTADKRIPATVAAPASVSSPARLREVANG
jgi:ABC-type sugar transport system ATPase subunit